MNVILGTSEKWCSKIKGKWIAMISLGTFVISLLPILYLSFFDYATGDDLGKGWRAHRVVVEGGSLNDFVKAIMAEAHAEYLGREGTWFSNVVLACPPNVFHERLYSVTAWISIITLCAGTYFALKLVIERLLGLSRNVTLVLFSLIGIVSIQYIPYIRGGVFWYTGVMHYQAPYCFALISLVALFYWMTEGKTGTLIGLFLCMFYIGGSHFQAMVISFFLFVVMLIWMLVKNKELEIPIARYAWAVGTLLVGGIGALFSLFAPGSAERAIDDGSTLGFSFGRIMSTVWDSVIAFGKDVLTYFPQKRLLLLFFPVVVVVVWNAGKTVTKKISPLVMLAITGICICLDILVYVPGLYIGGKVSGGVPNTNYYTFILATTIWTTCFTLFVKQRFGEKIKNWTSFLTIAFGIILILSCTVLFKHWIGQTADYMCYQYISSGQLADFREQMKVRLEILEDESIKDAALPPINPDQGPYMHMDLTEDPTKFTNQVTSLFYGKESVVLKTK